MATAKRSMTHRRRIWPRALLALVVIGGAAARSCGARTACSCRYVAGRPIGDCARDFEPGMEVVFLSDDPETRSVTARVPLLSSATARYREGYGCLLEPWN